MSHRQISLVCAVAFAEPANQILNGVFGDVGDNLHAGVRASANGEDPATHYFAEALVTETQFEALHDLKDTNTCPAKYLGNLEQGEADAAIGALQIFPLQSAAEALQSVGLQQVFDHA